MKIIRGAFIIVPNNFYSDCRDGIIGRGNGKK
jgi:hypothetical protein